MEYALGSFTDRPKREYERFLDLADAIAAGKGYDVEGDMGLVFWGELDDYEKAHEEPFDVACYLTGDECRLSHAEFYKYFELACRRYAQRYELAQEPLERSLRAYRERFFGQ